MAGKLTLLLLCAGIAIAQTRTTSARAGTVGLLQGNASIDGKPVHMRSGFPVQMNNGQSIHVDWGRVELRLGPGAGLTMTAGSTVLMRENRLSDVRVELEEGSALVRVDRIYKGGRLRVTVPGGAAEMHAGGWYRFDANPQRLRVYRGDVELALGDSVLKARKGQAMDFSNRLPAPLAVSAFNLKDPDSLIAWALQQSQADADRQRRQTERAAIQRARRAVQSDERRDSGRDQRGLPPMPSESSHAQ